MVLSGLYNLALFGYIMAAVEELHRSEGAIVPNQMSKIPLVFLAMMSSSYETEYKIFLDLDHVLLGDNLVQRNPVLDSSVE